MPSSLRLALATAAAFAAIGSGAAEAATITPAAQCFRYTSTSLAGEQWVGFSGSGFTGGAPGNLDMSLSYPGSHAGYAELTSGGAFRNGFLMPDDFIHAKLGAVKHYTVTGKDTKGVTASTTVTFIRGGVGFKPAHVNGNLHRTVKWSVFGAPTGAKMYAHWTFKGRRVVRHKVGKAKQACGIARKRMPLLPRPVRRGTWKIY